MGQINRAILRPEPTGMTDPSGVKDGATQQAIRQLQDRISQLINRVDKIERTILLKSQERNS